MKLMNVKLAAMAVLTAFSATAFGTAIFKKDSAVPADLQTQISETFESKCRLTKADRIQIAEEATYINTDRNDHGRAHYVYTTTFNAYRVRNNYNAGFLGQVIIKSAVYNHTFGSFTEVLSIQAPQTLHCFE